MFESLALLKHGGEWLGRARSWMQSKKRNGSTVTWGSDEVLIPHVTVRELEEVALYAAGAALGEQKSVQALNEILQMIDQGLLVQKEDMSGEQHFNLHRALQNAEKYRKVEA